MPDHYFIFLMSEVLHGMFDLVENNFCNFCCQLDMACLSKHKADIRFVFD